LLQQSFSLKQIQDWLGHSDISTTANVYAHVPYVEKVSIAKSATPIIGN
jgi:site-specific recombinase XerD